MSVKRYARCQTVELYVDQNEYVENNDNLTGFVSTIGIATFYAGRDHIPVGTPQLNVPV
jgi:hypothetical protein